MSSLLLTCISGKLSTTGKAGILPLTSDPAETSFESCVQLEYQSPKKFIKNKKRFRKEPQNLFWIWKANGTSAKVVLLT